MGNKINKTCAALSRRDRTRVQFPDEVVPEQDWKISLGANILSIDVARQFCVRLVEGLVQMWLRGQRIAGMWKPLHAQIMLFRSEEEFQNVPSNLKEAFAKARTQRVSKFPAGCYKHHFSHENPLHDGFLVTAAWAWIGANFFLPSLGASSNSCGGSGTRACTHASKLCPQALTFLVSEDRETLFAVQQGELTTLGDKTQPGFNESAVKRGIAELLAKFYVGFSAHQCAEDGCPSDGSEESSISIPSDVPAAADAVPSRKSIRKKVRSVKKAIVKRVATKAITFQYVKILRRTKIRSQTEKQCDVNLMD